MPTTTSTPNIENWAQTGYIGGNSPDGVIIGTSATEKVAFYGAVPVVQQNVGSVIATTVAISTGTIWGFASSTQANAITADVAAIQTALKNLGISV